MCRRPGFASCPPALALAIALMLPLACDGGGGGGPAVLPPDPTTLVERLMADPAFVPLGEEECPRLASPAYCGNPALSALDLSAWRSRGMGAMVAVGGEPLVTRSLAGATRGTGPRRRLVSFVQTTDVHVTDEESPLRQVIFDTRAISSAMRPAEGLAAQVLDALVRLANGHHAADPFDAFVITGDLTDSGQTNEFEWFAAIMAGGEVNPDSGNDDDPIPGPGNDPQDAFEAEGLAVPLVTVIGNHDIMLTGNSAFLPGDEERAMGDHARDGTRHGTSYEIIHEGVVADAARRPLPIAQSVPFLAARLPGGGGLSRVTDTTVAGVSYTIDLGDGAPVRMVVIDTGWRSRGFERPGIQRFDEGVLDRRLFADFLVPELERACSEGMLVVLASHHGLHSIQDDGHPERFVASAEIEAALLDHPCVVLHVFGHSHAHRVWLHERTDGTGGFVSLQTASLIDWPQQARFVELVDNGATLSIQAVAVAPAATGSAFARASLEAQLIDNQSEWSRDGLETQADERNVEIVLPMPAVVRDRVAAFAGSRPPAAQGSWAGLSP